MSGTSNPTHSIEPRGGIVVRGSDGAEAHIDFPVRLGDGIPGNTLVTPLLTLLEEAYGPMQSPDTGSDYHELSGWPCWTDWDTYLSEKCWLDRRGEEQYFGADGYFEQIVIGIIAAGGYEAIRVFANRAAAAIRATSPSSFGSHVDSIEHHSRIEEVLVPRYNLDRPLRILDVGDSDGFYHYAVTDAGNEEYWAAISADGILISGKRG